MSESFIALDGCGVRQGLYRHFQGKYYYVYYLSKDKESNEIMVTYVDVCHPEYGPITQRSSDFLAKKSCGLIIADRVDNVTGQAHVFERVRDLNNPVSDLSTEQLVKELLKRKDSPIHELDIPALKEAVFSKDFVIGEPVKPEDDELPQGVYTLNVFNDEESAREHLTKHAYPRRIGLFKRVFIELD